MAIKKDDFVEIDFTGRILSTGEVFDTTIKEIAEENQIEAKDLKPLIIAVGRGMLPIGFDKDLIGKEAGKEYVVEISPKEAFGERDSSLIKMIPTRLFHEQKIEPRRGMQLLLDGQLVRLLSSSGGRTLVDFNNPLAGKKVSYTYKINRRIEDIDEKINALQDFLFKKRFNFKRTQDEIIFKIPSGMEAFVEIFSKNFGDLFGLEIKSEAIKKGEEGN